MENKTTLQEQEIRTLIASALDARKKAYAPYSKYQVGAALLAKDGRIFTGCNVENAAFSPGSCAERTAVVKAVSEGVHSFAAIAITGGYAEQMGMAYPCGVCRQVLKEFVDEQEFCVITASDEAHYDIHTLAQLLPFGFGPDTISSEKN